MEFQKNPQKNNTKHKKKKKQLIYLLHVFPLRIPCLKVVLPPILNGDIFKYFIVIFLFKFDFLFDLVNDSLLSSFHCSIISLLSHILLN